MKTTVETTIGDPSRTRLVYRIARTDRIDEKVIYQIIVMGLFDRAQKIFSDPRYRFLGLGYGINVRVSHRFIITVAVGNHSVEPTVNISIFVDDNYRPWYVPEFYNYGEKSKVKLIGDMVSQIISHNGLLVTNDVPNQSLKPSP